MPSRSAQSLLFGPRQMPPKNRLIALEGPDGEVEAKRLVHLRGDLWAERQASRYRRQGDSHSAALLRAAALLDGRPDRSPLSPTGEWIIFKLCSSHDRHVPRLTDKHQLIKANSDQLIGYLFAAMPFPRTVDHLIKLIDEPPAPTLMSITAELLEERCPDDQIGGEIMRRRSLYAFNRRSRDLDRLEAWVKEAPRYGSTPLFWREVQQGAFEICHNQQVFKADLSNPDVATQMAIQLGSDDIGISAMLAFIFPEDKELGPEIELS